ncbi:MAG: zinc-dependent metalloprotease [Scytolyngbya sp. HA4215-MV1]|jgi:hypothetical protein|nr:zinc-dependent metalloprotease [Scytolyngbya sp. HA4215-MV1]
MKKILLCFAFLLGIGIALGSGTVHTTQVHATQSPHASTMTPLSSPTIAPIALPSVAGSRDSQSQQLAAAPTAKASPDAADPDAPKFEDFDKVVKGARKLNGLFTLYYKANSGKLYLEIQPTQLNRNFLGVMTLESGVGEFGLYRGMPIGDFLFTLQRIKNNIQFVIPNVYFRTRLGDPTPRALSHSFSDSTLYTLPIKSIHPQRKTLLVDLETVLLSDSPGLTTLFSSLAKQSYKVDAEKAYFGTPKAFPKNIELESVFGFVYNGGTEPLDLESLPDNRAFSLSVRYSLSELPENNGYRPRMADDRVGYFITAYQNFSDDEDRDPFVRYINRWHLEKQNPQAELSPPKKPIVFWIENTVPVEYRDAVREGILLWNKAFAKIGFQDAIQVKQMPPNADWDPADVRYNTIRWFSAVDAGFAVGPSRVNPLTGEILDADILVDSGFTRYTKQEYRTLVEPEQVAMMPLWLRLTGNPNLCTPEGVSQYLRHHANQLTTALPQQDSRVQDSKILETKAIESDRCYHLAAAQQFAIGSMALSTFQNVLPSSAEQQAYVHQFLRHLIAHEVGHTLGLRHNFHASSMLRPEELNNTEITHDRGLVASVMDYAPVNLAPAGTQQGDYYTTLVGPYDEWAIAYGYQPSNSLVPQAELPKLNQLAARAPEPDLSYGTDEDFFSAIDPMINVFDLSADLLTYGQWQMNNANQLWDRLDKRYPTKGERYNDVRIMFDTVFGYYANYASFIVNYIGGQSFNRFRAGDAADRLPFEPVPVEKQREALAVLQKNVFEDTHFHFSPKLLNKLAPSRWLHWGSLPRFSELDYPIHERVLFLQSLVLSDLLSSQRLNRLRNTELKTAPGEALTLPELFENLQSGIWREVLQSDQKPLQISSFRRALQRQYMNTLINLALRNSNAAIQNAQTLPDLILAMETADAPEDARTLAWYELRQLHDVLRSTIRKQHSKLDTYTRAHLEEAYDRIGKALDANLQSQ